MWPNKRCIKVIILLIQFEKLKLFFLKKMVMITLYAKQKKRHRCIEQTFGLCGRRRGWDVSISGSPGLFFYLTQ